MSAYMQQEQGGHDTRGQCRARRHRHDGPDGQVVAARCSAECDQEHAANRFHLNRHELLVLMSTDTSGNNRSARRSVARGQRGNRATGWIQS